jgi:hypothetical protein
LTEEERKNPTPEGSPHDEDWVPADDAVIGRAFRWSLVVAGVALVLVLAGIGVARLVRADPVDRAIEGGAAIAVSREATPPTVAFSDVTAASGIAFVHHNGAYGEKLLPETMGGGVAIVDYDGDGDQDLFFVDSTRWSEGPADSPSGALALYENDGSGRFTPGPATTLWSMIGKSYVTSISGNPSISIHYRPFAPTGKGVASRSIEGSRLKRGLALK